MAEPPPERRASPSRRWLVTAVLVLLLAAALLAALAGRWDGPSGSDGGERLMLLLLLVLAGFLGLEFRLRGQGDRLDLFDAALAVVLVSLPGPEVVALVALAKAVTLAVQRVPAVKTAFNVAQWSCAAAAGSLVVAGMHVPGSGTARDLLVLLLALVVVAAVNTGAVAVVLALVGAGRAAWTGRGGLVHGALVSAPVNLGLGLALATLWVRAPEARWLVPVVLIAVHLGTRLWAQRQAGTARVVGLQRATALLAGPDDLDTALPPFLDELRRAFACAGAELHLAHGPGQAWTRTTSGDDAGAASSDGLVAELVRRGSSVRLPDSSADPVLLAGLAAAAWGDCLAAPVRSQGEVVGLLCTHTRHGWQGFESTELAVLEAVAGVLGESVHRNRLGEVLHRERVALRDAELRWRVVARILELVARGTPLPETLDQLARTVEEQTDEVWCAVLVRVPGQELTVAAPTVPARASAALRTALLQQLPSGPPAETSPAGSDPERVLREAGVGSLHTFALTCSSDGGAEGVLALCARDEAPTCDLSRLAADAARAGALAVDHVLVQQRLAHQAAHDTLTDLPNRSVFLDRLELALRGTERSGTWALVLFLDLDRFKVVNDSLGHRVGDALLRAVAERLRAAVRPADTVARFGGDEFMILCEGVQGEAHAVRVVQRVQEALAPPFPLGDSELFVTSSIGIAVGQGAAKTPENLIEDADAAMYRAKAGGGNRFELFDVVMRDRAVQRLTLHSALHRALERGEFRVVYQPTVRLSTGQVEGVEALVRWDRPDHGVVPPAEFVPLAEETGLIVPIGAYVLEEACQQAACWRRAAGPGQLPLSVSVNLSARQLSDPCLVDLVEGALQRSGVEPGGLSLEITESVLMSDVAASGEVLTALKALGVTLLVDDFGTGYSSLTYLQRFPVDGLKVDQSFVAGLGATTDALTIVRAVIGLAHGLGLTAVAEGVETATQVRHLIDLDCDVAQGFHFGRPAAADALRLVRPEPTVPGTRGGRRLALAQPDDLAPRR